MTSTDELTRCVLDLPINPVPLGRPRVVQGAWGGTPHTFTPPRSEQFVNDFRWALRAIPHRPRRPYTVPLAISLRFWRQHTGGSRGDLDNLVKAVLDAGNGELWVDDRQIVHLTAGFEEAGSKVTGRIVLELRPALTADRATVEARMAVTLGRLRTIAEVFAEELGALHVSRLDQSAMALREYLAQVDVDLDDPTVRRALIRAFDGTLRSIEYLIDEGPEDSDVDIKTLRRTVVLHALALLPAGGLNQEAIGL